MAIRVEYGPPPSMMATAAMQAGYLKGDVERRKFQSEEAIKGQQLALQAQRMGLSYQQMLRQERLQREQMRQRQVEGLRQEYQRIERERFQATQQEYMENVGAEQDLDAEIAEKLEQGLVKYPPATQQELDDIDSNEAIHRRRFADGEIDRETFMAGMNRFAARRRALRRNYVPVPPNERPPVYTWSDGQQQKPTEVVTRGGVEYGLRSDGHGGYFPMQIGPDYPNTKEGKEAEVRIKATEEAKIKQKEQAVSGRVAEKHRRFQRERAEWYERKAASEKAKADRVTWDKKVDKLVEDMVEDEVDRLQAASEDPQKKRTDFRVSNALKEEFRQQAEGGYLAASKPVDAPDPGPEPKWDSKIAETQAELEEEGLGAQPEGEGVAPAPILPDSPEEPTLPSPVGPEQPTGPKPGDIVDLDEVPPGTAFQPEGTGYALYKDANGNWWAVGQDGQWHRLSPKQLEEIRAEIAAASAAPPPGGD